MAKLITDYHNGADLYSDGAVEDELLELFKSGGDVSSMLKTDKRWPVLYHLSPDRRNLLEWFPFRKEGSLLEIGAGCGALTGLFAEKVARVTAVELSLRRSRIIEERYRRIENIEVIAGSLSDLEIKDKFDYVTLVGVLEYARSFVKGESPACKLLEICRARLKPEGTLFVAIENKFGLKYFAGAREDHSGRSFESIEGYRADAPAETWSRAELSSLLKKAGFAGLKYYYPYPDYKLPEEIFSDDNLPDLNHIMKNSPNYDRDRYRLFSEKRALLNIIADGKFDYFSNSFLVLASQEEHH
jgi:SAM-dependent methyltransferase